MGKNNIFIKSIFRKPLKVILIFLIVVLMSFTFVTRIVEYTVINKEVKRLSDYYKPVGRLIPVNSEDTDLSKEAANTLGKDENVELLNIQRSFCGLMDETTTPARDPIFPLDIVYYYGKITFIDVLEDESKPYFLDESNRCRYDCTIYVVPDKTVIGFPENLTLNEQLIIHWYVDDKELLDSILKELKVGNRYFFKNLVTYFIFNNEKKMTYYLEPFEGEKYVYSADDGDVTLENQKDLEDIWLREIQKHALVVNTSKGMEASPEFQEKYHLTQGRYITNEDNREAQKVCVVRSEFAEENGLSVGDKLPLTITDNANPKYYLSENQSWPEGQYVNESFEIIGTYTSQNLEGTNFLCDEVFVPDSIFPKEWGQNRTFLLDGLYFVIDSPEGGTQFLKNTQTSLEQGGYAIEFIENGWENFKTASEPMKQSARMGILVFGIILVITFIAVSAAFIALYYKMWITIRFLGVPRKKASGQFGAAVIMIGGIGAVLGSVLSWNYALKKANETLAVLHVDKDVSGPAALPLYVLFIFSFAIVLLWMLISLIILGCFSKGTLLDKLHTRQKTKKKACSKDLSDSLEKASAMKSDVIAKVKFDEGQVVNNDTTGEFSEVLPGTIHIEFYMRYIYHHFSCTVWKNLLIIFVIGGFVFCLGWMQGNIKHNEDKIRGLYENTTVSGKIVPQAGSNYAENGAYIYSDVVDTFSESGYIDKFILEASVSTVLESSKNKEVVSTETYGIGNIEVYEPIKDSTVNITYMDGYDDSVFEISEEASDDEKMVMIVSEEIMSSLDLKLGDTVKAVFMQNSGGLPIRREKEVKVVGTYPYKSGYFVYAPLVSLKSFIGNDNLYYTRAEFEIKKDKNREIAKFKEMISDVTKRPENQYMAKISCLIQDDELVKALDPLQKNVDLMRLLYPMIIVIVVIILALGNIFVILMTEKEAAIMRVLGTPHKSIAMIIAIRQFILNVTGIGIGLGAVAAMIGGRAVMQKTLFCVGLCLIVGIVSDIGAVIAVVTRRHPMDLLSVKE